MNLGIVYSAFYSEISTRMLEVAKEKAASLGINVTQVSKVSGAYDIPLIADTMLDRNDIDAIVTLGSIIRGKTKHDEVISHAIASSLLEVSIRHKKPVALGISGPGMQERQAYARIRPVAEHAVESALASFNENTRIKS